ncbi:MAG: hypothetical protein LUB83_04680 [Prevotellaceae bacterium]|nr:hypothetical protein [Prevotellaceae bacterium]
MSRKTRIGIEGVNASQCIHPTRRFPSAARETIAGFAMTHAIHIIYRFHTPWEALPSRHNHRFAPFFMQL